MKKYRHLAFAILFSLTTLTITGCASTKTGGQSGDEYSQEGVQAVEEIQTAVIESIKPVEISGNITPIGNTTVGILGRVAGAAAGGGGAASQILANLGGMLGSILGASAEEKISRKPGIKLTLKLEYGETIAIVQAKNDKEIFKVGDKVQVIEKAGIKRVAHL